MRLEKRIITQPILFLSLISFFTDVASEMLYPIMPLYLTQIGYTVVFVGILEGIAEVTAGLSKGYFGNMSDVRRQRVPFIRIGYALSAISKPMLAVCASPLWIFFARTTDRLGKGLRTGARDAMLADESLPEHRGRVFGFHRAMDTFGALLGPGIALAFLQFYPGSYDRMFLIAFVPGALAVAFTTLLKEPKTNPHPDLRTGATSISHFLVYLTTAPRAYNRLVIGLLGFALLNSSDAFLILLMKQRGVSDRNVIAAYMLYNLIFALFSYPAGTLADRMGLKQVFTLGLCIFSAVYAGMGVGYDLWHFFGLLVAYGLYAASTDGISKAWISKIVPRQETATAIGTYAAMQSVASLLASALAGLIWYGLGPSAMFLTSGIGTLMIVLYFLV